MNLIDVMFGQYRIRYFNCFGDIFPLVSIISSFRCAGIDLGPTDLKEKVGFNKGNSKRVHDPPEDGKCYVFCIHKLRVG